MRPIKHSKAPNSLLPCAPEPATGEGLLGYRLRLSEINQYPTSSWIYDGPVASTVLRGYEALGRSEFLDVLAALTAIDRSKLAQALLFPKKLYIRSVNLSLARVCPACLEETAFLRKLWDLSLYVVCPIHGAYLLDSCPVCKADITWSRSHVTTCHCGFDFRATKTLIAEAGEINLTKYLVHAANDAGTTDYFRQPGLDLDDSFPNLDLPLDELCTLIMFLGGLSLHGIRRKTFMQPRMIEMPYARSLVHHTATLFQDWPGSLQRALELVASSHKGAEYAGLRSRFGYMYVYLYNNMPSHHFEFLRKIFEEFVRDNFVGHLSSGNFPRLSKAIRLQSKYVNIAEAAKRLGVSRVEVRELLDKQVLAGTLKRDKSGRYKAFIERSVLDGFVPASRDFIHLEEARRMLGLEKYRARELVKSKYLKAILGSSKATGGWRISKSSIEQLLAKLRGGDLPILKKRMPRTKKTLRNLLSCYVTAHDQFPFLIRAALDGKISPIGQRKDIPGLSGLVFQLADVLQLLQSLNHLTGYCTIDQSVEYLQLETSFIYRLLAAGLLKAHRAPIGFRGTLYIPASDLRDFQARYITTPEVMRLTGQCRATVNAALRRMGIKRIRGAKPVRSCVGVYQRQPVLLHLTELRKLQSAKEIKVPRRSSLNR